ncbi:hypothetical protein B0J12DRAFT_76733 [Macrophomina phaseolina]|uniref:TM7S3/TM198-like domain-containing protein n=1 Tax=Macrophomina phaseolina TaxID=35725 RepID=A0ABQ8GBG8_9PEZI|nr:hypothetical protein B0J12DRAFT_76733 [Macrophomina phaseolina]
MQLPRSLVALLLFLLCAQFTSAAVVHARQLDDDSASTSVQRSGEPTTTTTGSTREATSEAGRTATRNEASHTAATSIETRTRNSAESSVTAAVSTTSLTDIPSAAVPSGTAAASSTAAVYSGRGLPLQPKVTPAIGIAGAVLIITGAIYTLIGIKNHWVNIGGSVAFLVALSITVLVEYVMNPPVTDAVQGAFFVAAFIPALLAGGVAFIFRDITEGLGCLLGGFCVSMWFLVLKSGGLITSTTGRAIFIGVFSAVGWALSFSHYTRTYGLIGCTSFAGATITVIGIDCFSRAGLKEFWLYIWDLNNDTFPLFTNTYPITRGIRVEIACIIIISLLGVASQMKLWRVVKARREQRDAIRRQKAEEQERMDEEIGKRIVEDTDRERAQWEALYGDKTYGEKTAELDHPDSGMGSEHAQKASVSVRELSRGASEESVEMYELESGAREGSQAQIISQYATPEERVDDIQQIDGHGRPLPPAPGYFSTNYRSSMVPKRQDSMEYSALDQGAYSDGSAGTTPRISMSAPPPPQHVPLPFVVPTGNDSSSELLEQQSIVSIPEELLRREDSAHRLSAHPNSKRSSNIRNSHATSEENLIEPDMIEDDRASSIAATLDDMNEEVISLPALSRVGTPFSRLDRADGGQEDAGIESAESEAIGDETARDSPATGNAFPQEAQMEGQHEGLASAPPRPLTSSTDPKLEDKQATRKDRRKSGTSTDPQEVGSSSDNQARSRRSTAQSEIAHSIVGSLSDHLPDKLSKVMLTYRTNEWAKHVSMAEQPELESIPEPSSPGVMVDLGFKNAAETPQKTPDPSPHTEAKPERDSRDESQPAYQPKQYRQSLQRSSSSQSKNVQLNDTPVPLSRNSSSATLGNTSHINLQRNSSASSLPTISRPGSALAGNGTRGLRISSSPVNAPIAEQPSEEHMAESRVEKRYSHAPMPTNTLMSERDSRMRNKPTKMSFIAPPGQSPVVQAHGSQRVSRAPSAANSARSFQMGQDEADPDNMPLSQRKLMIQKNRMSSQQQQRNSSYPSLSAQNFDSHQPHRERESSNQQEKREQMFASWRGSLQHDQQLRQPAQRENEGRRSAMISERRNKEWAQQQQEINRQHIDMMIHEKMRTGQMQQLHRERLRRLQAGAKTE